MTHTGATKAEVNQRPDDLFRFTQTRCPEDELLVRGGTSISPESPDASD
jgi:hypothetical protein